jgi:SprA-related family
MSHAISSAATMPAPLHSQDRLDPTMDGSPTATGPEPSKDPSTAARGSSNTQQHDRVTLSADAQVVRELAARDSEVRTHEAAHAAAGGGYAGSPSFSYQKGPDGQSYAVGGEVSIDTSKVSGDPLATLQKAETIRAAALAPTQPSSADRAIAAKAAAMASQARADLAAQEPDKASSMAIEEPPAPSSANEENAGSLLNRYI